MKIVGIKEVNYKSKSDGSERHGIEVHGTYPSSRCSDGVLTDKQFLSDYIIEKCGGRVPKVGEEITFRYNRLGRLEDYEVI